MHARARSVRSLLVLALAAPPLAAQSVLVVDDDAPADFADLGAAVAAAADGDVVLVREGFYNAAGGILVDGKSLVIAAEAGARVSISNGPLVVRDTAAGQTVLVQGLALAPAPLGEGLRIEACQGVVQVEDVLLQGAILPQTTALDAITVLDSAAVVLARTSASGSDSNYLAQAGGAGLRATRSKVHLFETGLAGGRGGSDTTSGGPGGPGVVLEDGFLFAAGSSVQGGTGGPAGHPLFGCSGGTSGAGGAGIVLTGTTPDARLLDTALAGGDPGAVFGTCDAGPAGAPSQVLAGALGAYAWPTHGFALEGPVHEGESATLSFEGPAGEFAWYLYAADATTLFLPPLAGTLALASPLFAVPVGTLDGTGRASVTVSAALPPAAQATRFHLQALYLDTQANVFTLSTPAALVVLADGL